MAVAASYFLFYNRDIIFKYNLHFDDYYLWFYADHGETYWDRIKEFFFIYPDRLQSRPATWLLLEGFITPLKAWFDADRISIASALTIHALSTALLFRQMKRAVGGSGVAAAVGAIFFIFAAPSQRASTWFAAMFDLCACLCTVSAMAFWQGYEEKENPVFGALFLLFYFLSIRSKEIALLLPIALGLRTWIDARGSVLAKKPFFFPLSVALMLAASWRLHSSVAFMLWGEGREGGYRMTVDLGTFLHNLFFHLHHLTGFVPVMSGPSSILAGVTLFAGLGILFGLGGDCRKISGDCVGFLLLFFPLAFFGARDFIYLSYVPSIFLAFALARVVGSLESRAEGPRRAAVQAGALAMISSLPILVNREYRDHVDFTARFYELGAVQKAAIRRHGAAIAGKQNVVLEGRGVGQPHATAFYTEEGALRPFWMISGYPIALLVPSFHGTLHFLESGEWKGSGSSVVFCMGAGGNLALKEQGGRCP